MFGQYRPRPSDKVTSIRSFVPSRLETTKLAVRVPSFPLTIATNLLLGEMAKKSTESSCNFTGTPHWQERALQLGQTHVSFIQEQVLARAGLTGIDVVPTGPKPYTRYNKFGNPSAFFSDPVDDTAVLRTGAGYWYMSVKEYGKFLTALRNGKIVGWQYAKSMQDNHLGMYRKGYKHGTYWDHNGGYPGQPNDPGAMADWMMFPNGIVAVIFVNSKGGTIKQPQTIVSDSCDAAW